MYDKKVNALGLTSVLSVPDNVLPPEVATGLPQLLSGLIKLLTGLKSQQVPHLQHSSIATSSVFCCQ
jgi:hypothetical protein